MANTYDSSTVMLGDELFVYIQDGSGNTYSPVAYTTTCSLSIKSDTIDTANKMDGAWTSAKSGKLSWTISSENLLADGNGTDFDYFYDKMVKRQPFLVRFGRAKDANNADYSLNTATGKTYYEGKAYMTSCELSADNGSAASLSVELTGNGALTKTVSAGK